MTPFQTGILLVGGCLLLASFYHIAHSPTITRGLTATMQSATNRMRAWSIACYVRRRTCRRALRKLEGVS